MPGCWAAAAWRSINKGFVFGVVGQLVEPDAKQDPERKVSALFDVEQAQQADQEQEENGEQFVHVSAF